jgi:hypothetical protein
VNAEASPVLRIQSIKVCLDDGVVLSLEPTALLLCAGEQNRDLLRRVQAPAGGALPSSFAQLDELHNATQMDMLVIRDHFGALPFFNGSVFGGTVQDRQGQTWNVNAFIVTRDQNQDRVWICSGRVSRVSSKALLEGRDFRRLFITYLGQVFPVVQQQQPRLEWGVYPARLVTLNSAFPGVAGTRPLDSRKYLDMGIERLLVCYTDRLTITPLAAENIGSVVATNWPPTAVPFPGLPRVPRVPVHPEYWQVPLLWDGRSIMNWSEFELNCLAP